MIVHDSPVELYPGVWMTGPVARIYPERNFGIGPGAKVQMPDGSWAEDTVPEDMSLVIDTDRGVAGDRYGSWSGCAIGLRPCGNHQHS